MSFQAEPDVLTAVPAALGDLPESTRLISLTGPPRSAAANLFSAQTVRGGIYLTARYGLGVVVSLGNMLVMTWWIGPHSYGLFVTAIGLVAFLSNLARAGVDTYLVRRKAAPGARLYDVAATLILSVSIGLTLMGAALAPVLIRWYGSREFVAPYMVLLLSIP